MRARWFAPSLLLATLAGCQGNIQGTAPTGGVGPGATGPNGATGPGTSTETPPGGFDTKSECQKLGTSLNPGPSPLRRLTRDEYDSTIADLAGDTSKPGSDFPPEARALGFNNIADAQTVTSLLAESYKTAAEGIADRATKTGSTLLGCSETDATCVDGFIQRFGSRAYRRPLAADEATRLHAVYAWGQQNTTALDGVRMVLEVLLQSPDFLYRPELGSGEASSGVLHLSSYEMATRLSYFLRGSMPDQTLLDEAAADRLKTPEQVLAQAQRLLSDPRARETFKSFHRQWLDLDRTSTIERDPKVYAGYTDAIPGLLKQETETFIDHVIFEDGGKLSTLLTAPYTFANSTLASYYGLTPPAGDAFAKVDTNPAQRKGLLTQGSLLALQSGTLQTSPVHRGKFVRESLLCQFLPPPPANLVITPPEVDANSTTRQRFAKHSADPVCAGCHGQMDPVGLGFEHFDPSGRWRDMENGLPIDATGNLILTDVDGAFDGAAALADKLASSEQVADCMMKEWTRFALGRSETTEDACTLERTKTKFAGADHDIKQLVLALTQTDAFLYRKAVAP
jgi:Protein of unknown function (DUF1592)/Protein of unknown function (DUF1588)/Protein of unknown function (DUF1587)/Protein of unknown function (DUF1595)/Protein of unknown function (DUF1585)